MYYLGIDSSTKKLGIGLSRDDRILDRINFCSDKGFMVNIIRLIDRLLKKNSISLSSIDNFCVNVGPGDFTGTRIGISIAKTFALVENKNILGINTLDVFALQLMGNNISRIGGLLSGEKNILIIPILDVRRDELFFSVYQPRFELYPDKNSVGSMTYKSEEVYLNKILKDYLINYENFSSFLEDIFLKENLIASSRERQYILTGGTAFNSYRHLYSDVKNLNYNFMFDKKSVNPDVKYLNLCAYFRKLYKINDAEEKVIAPYYVREFLTFNRK